MRRREFFDRHAAGWDAGGAAMEGRLRRVVQEAEVGGGHCVLDVGTGTGVLVPFLTEAVGCRGIVIALDYSREMLAQARDKHRAPNVLLVHGDAHALPLRDGSCHRVICNAVFPHFEDRPRALAELLRVLRAGGVLVISHPIGRAAVNRRHREAGGPVGEDRVPEPEAMVALLAGAGLVEVVVVDEPEFYLARGRRPAA